MSNDLPGWVGAADYNSDFNRDAHHIRQHHLSKLRTNVLVKVMDVRPGKYPHSYEVDVQPLVNQVDGAGQKQEHGTIYGIPMLSGSGGNGAVIVKPKKGDMGLMAVMDRDSSAAIAANGPANPGSRRMHALEDSVYLGGFMNQNDSGHYIIADENGFTIKGDLTIDGDVKATGEVVARTSGNNIHLSTHTHPGTGSPTPGS